MPTTPLPSTPLGRTDEKETVRLGWWAGVRGPARFWLPAALAGPLAAAAASAGKGAPIGCRRLRRPWKASTSGCRGEAGMADTAEQTDTVPKQTGRAAPGKRKPAEEPPRATVRDQKDALR